MEKTVGRIESEAQTKPQDPANLFRHILSGILKSVGKK
jgi:hypothetical protein